jgi:anti-anti-sigma factor
MAFTAVLSTRPGIAIIDLQGDLDSSTAPVFRAKVEAAAAVVATQLVLDMTRLDYLSSAGLRGLVFARQKMGSGMELVVVGANAAVTETIRLTGFDQSVTFSERVPG